MDQARRYSQQQNSQLTQCRPAGGLADDGEADEQRQVLREFGQERGKDESR
jgi:hypothetical protein